MRDQIQEDKHTSPCTEGHMHPTLLDAKAFAHGALNIEDIDQFFTFLEMWVTPDNLWIIVSVFF